MSSTVVAEGTKRMCPFCGVIRGTRVADTRETADGGRRRRVACLTCDGRWTMYEATAEQVAARTAGSRAALVVRIGRELRDACVRLPVTEGAIREAVRHAIDHVHPLGAPRPAESHVRAAIDRALRGLHPVAHVRWAMAMGCESAADCLSVLVEYMGQES